MGCTRSHSRVYPRTCGGTSGKISRINGDMGLSPHVRGNHVGLEADAERQGSIPARAGEPISGCRRPGCPGVYPRTCGGTRDRPTRIVRLSGLSPHVRGNHGERRYSGPLARSIPARAGEPSYMACPFRLAGVYPRTCGGTDTEERQPGAHQGLSPHVRGNLIASRLHRV